MKYSLIRFASFTNGDEDMKEYGTVLPTLGPIEHVQAVVRRFGLAAYEEPIEPTERLYSWDLWDGKGGQTVRCLCTKEQILEDYPFLKEEAEEWQPALDVFEGRSDDHFYDTSNYNWQIRFVGTAEQVWQRENEKAGDL